MSDLFTNAKLRAGRIGNKVANAEDIALTNNDDSMSVKGELDALDTDLTAAEDRISQNETDITANTTNITANAENINRIQNQHPTTAPTPPYDAAARRFFDGVYSERNDDSVMTELSRGINKYFSHFGDNSPISSSNTDGYIISDGVSWTVGQEHITGFDSPSDGGNEGTGLWGKARIEITNFNTATTYTIFGAYHTDDEPYPLFQIDRGNLNYNTNGSRDNQDWQPVRDATHGNITFVNNQAVNVVIEYHIHDNGSERSSTFRRNIECVVATHQGTTTTRDNDVYIFNNDLTLTALEGEIEVNRKFEVWQGGGYLRHYTEGLLLDHTDERLLGLLQYTTHNTDYANFSEPLNVPELWINGTKFDADGIRTYYKGRFTLSRIRGGFTFKRGDEFVYTEDTDNPLRVRVLSDFTSDASTQAPSTTRNATVGDFQTLGRVYHHSITQFEDVADTLNPYQILTTDSSGTVTQDSGSESFHRIRGRRAGSTRDDLAAPSEFGITGGGGGGTQGPRGYQGVSTLRIFHLAGHGTVAPSAPSSVGVTYNPSNNTYTGLDSTWGPELSASYNPGIHDVYSAEIIYDPSLNSGVGGLVGNFVNVIRADADVGAQGPRGLPGAQGETGPTGPRGLQGEQGVQGERGLQGPAGRDGVDGSQGPTGPTGPRGLQGIQGIQGERGLQGEQGPAGTTTFDGLTDVQNLDTNNITEFLRRDGIFAVPQGTGGGGGSTTTGNLEIITPALYEQNVPNTRADNFHYLSGISADTAGSSEFTIPSDNLDDALLISVHSGDPTRGSGDQGITTARELRALPAINVGIGTAPTNTNSIIFSQLILGRDAQNRLLITWRFLATMDNTANRPMPIRINKLRAPRGEQGPPGEAGSGTIQEVTVTQSTPEADDGDNGDINFTVSGGTVNIHQKEDPAWISRGSFALGGVAEDFDEYNPYMASTTLTLPTPDSFNAIIMPSTATAAVTVTVPSNAYGRRFIVANTHASLNLTVSGASSQILTPGQSGIVTFSSTGVTSIINQLPTNLLSRITTLEGRREAPLWLPAATYSVFSTGTVPVATLNNYNVIRFRGAYTLTIGGTFNSLTTAQLNNFTAGHRFYFVQNDGGGDCTIISMQGSTERRLPIGDRYRGYFWINQIGNAQWHNLWEPPQNL